MLLGEKNEILSNVNRPDNYFVYAPFIEKLLVPADISTYAKNLYNIYPHDGEMLSGQKRSVFFLNAQENSKKEKITLLGNLHNCVWVINDKRYEVFSGHINLLVSNHDSINGFELFVNNKGILLSQLECIQAESQRVYDIGKLFDENIPYEIYLYSHVLQKELFRIKLVYFKDFNIKFNQNLFYGEDIKKLTILENGNVQELTWENHQDQIEVEIRNGKLIIDIPYLRWCIDDFEWNNAPLTGMVWYKDLFHNGSLLDVSVPYGNEDIQIFAMLANQIVEVKKNLNGKFEIGRCIFANEDKKLITFGIKMQHALQSVKLFEVATQEHFWDEPLIVRGDKIIFHLQNFIGSSSRIFKITLTKIGQEPICTSSDKLIDGIIPNIAEGIYWVNITSQSGGLFFKKEQVFWEGEFTFGDKDRLQLANMLYKISPLNGQALSDSWKMVVSGYYVSNLIRLDGRPDVYTAKLFYMTADKSKQLINNIEICQIEILFKENIMKHHTLEGVITCNTDTFYGVGTNPVIAVFTAHEKHPKDKVCKFIDFRDDGYEVRAHVGLVEGDSAKDKRKHLLNVWNGRVEAPSKFCVESEVTAEDEWLHSFYYFNDEIPTDADFEKAIGDYLTFEFSMIMQNREYLFEEDDKKDE